MNTPSLSNQQIQQLLRKSGARSPVEYTPGQRSVKPTVERQGQYTVAVAPTSSQNSLTQLASFLNKIPSIANAYKGIAEQAAEIEVAQMDPEQLKQELKKRAEKGDEDAGFVLKDFYKEEALVRNIVGSVIKNDAEPKIQSYLNNIKNYTPAQTEQLLRGGEDEARGRIRAEIENLLPDDLQEVASQTPYANGIYQSYLNTLPSAVEKVHATAYAQRTKNIDNAAIEDAYDAANQQLQSLPTSNTSVDTSGSILPTSGNSLEAITTAANNFTLNEDDGPVVLPATANSLSYATVFNKKSNRVGPDNQSRISTVEDYVKNGDYVTALGNPDQYGKSWVMDTLTYTDGNGQEQTLENVPIYIHHSNASFKTATEGQYALARSKDSKERLTADSEFLNSSSLIFDAETSSPDDTPVPKTPDQIVEQDKQTHKRNTAFQVNSLDSAFNQAKTRIDSVSHSKKESEKRAQLNQLVGDRLDDEIAKGNFELVETFVEDALAGRLKLGGVPYDPSMLSAKADGAFNAQQNLEKRAKAAEDKEPPIFQDKEFNNSYQVYLDAIKSANETGDTEQLEAAKVDAMRFVLEAVTENNLSARHQDILEQHIRLAAATKPEQRAAGFAKLDRIGLQENKFGTFKQDQGFITYVREKAPEDLKRLLSVVDDKKISEVTREYPRPIADRAHRATLVELNEVIEANNLHNPNRFSTITITDEDGEEQEVSLQDYYDERFDFNYNEAAAEALPEITGRIEELRQKLNIQKDAELTEADTEAGISEDDLPFVRNEKRRTYRMQTEKADEKEEDLLDDSGKLTTKVITPVTTSTVANLGLADTISPRDAFRAKENVRRFNNTFSSSSVKLLTTHNTPESIATLAQNAHKEFFGNGLRYTSLLLEDRRDLIANGGNLDENNRNFMNLMKITGLPIQTLLGTKGLVTKKSTVRPDLYSDPVGFYSGSKPVTTTFDYGPTLRDKRAPKKYAYNLQLTGQLISAAGAGEPLEDAPFASPIYEAYFAGDPDYTLKDFVTDQFNLARANGLTKLPSQ